MSSPTSPESGLAATADPMSSASNPQLDVLGVGIGPSNLSVAALLAPLSVETSSPFWTAFFDERPEFHWHPDFLFPEATIQNCFLKDLVTLADPANPYSFLAFLAQSGRLYRFISAGLPAIKRLEFDQYYRWVCAALPNLNFRSPVTRIDFDGDGFRADIAGRPVRARHLLLGTGLRPLIPGFARPHLGPRVFHTSRFLQSYESPAGRRLAIVGGGQSGAEVLRHVLMDERGLPESVHWISTRAGLLPLDNSAFSEEIFTPSYSDFFFSLPASRRERLLHVQRLASDGISTDLLTEIYRRLYDLEFNLGAGRICRLHVETELIAMNRQTDRWQLKIRDNLTETDRQLTVDEVVLATGFEYRLPECLEPLRERFDLDDDGRFKFRDDFSIAWDHADDHQIFVQNAARHCRGVPDPNLSLMAWRSAKIVNSLLAREAYNVRDASSVFDWPAAVSRH